MENNVVTLETAKKLKAAEWHQPTNYGWFQPLGYDDWELIGPKYYKDHSGKWLCAPTAQEIADQLPDMLHDPARALMIFPEPDSWVADYLQRDEAGYMRSEAPTMAEALALLWLKLNQPDQEDDDGK